MGLITACLHILSPHVCAVGHDWCACMGRAVITHLCSWHSHNNCLIATCTWLVFSIDRTWCGPLQGAGHLPAPAQLSISRLPMCGMLQEAPDQPRAGQQKGDAAHGPLQSKFSIISLFQFPDLFHVSCVVQMVKKLSLGACMPDNGNAVVILLIETSCGFEATCSGPFGSLLCMMLEDGVPVHPCHPLRSTTHVTCLPTPSIHLERVLKTGSVAVVHASLLCLQCACKLQPGMLQPVQPLACPIYYVSSSGWPTEYQPIKLPM